jgi:beta-galactosidase
MMLSYDSRFAFDIQPNNPQLSYAGQFHQIYRALYNRNVAVDIVEPASDLSPYKLVIAPSLHVVTDADAEQLESFVQAGGTLVVLCRSGVKDEFNAVVNRRLPGPLAELCGVEVEEYDSLPIGVHNRIEYSVPELAATAAMEAGTWCDVLHPTNADVVARYTVDFYAGKPAITLSHHGEGRAIYVGTLGDDAFYEVLATWILGLAGVAPLLNAPHGVEVAERLQGEQRLVFVLNHTDHEQKVTLSKPYTDLLSERPTLNGTVSIAPKGVLVLVAND